MNKYYRHLFEAYFSESWVLKNLTELDKIISIIENDCCNKYSGCDLDDRNIKHFQGGPDLSHDKPMIEHFID